MSTSGKMDFPRMIRDLRIQAGLKHREVAVSLGLKPNSYSNAESLNRKTISAAKVRRLAKLYNLNESDTTTLVAAWESLPISEYSAQQRKKWDVRNAMRNKSKRAGALEVALVEVLGMLLPQFPDPESLCICEFGSAEPCEVCAALQALGLTGWTSLDQVLRELAALQEKLAKPSPPVLPE